MAQSGLNNSINKVMDEHNFIYFWLHLPTKKWYIGSRTAKGCHVNDGYICSSKTVKPLIKSNPDEWIRKILYESPSKLIIRNLEASILQDLDAKNDLQSFNKHNNDGKFFSDGRPFGSKASVETKNKMSVAHKGDKNFFFGKNHSAETKEKISKKCTGYKHTVAAKEKISKANRGKIFSDEHRIKISENMKQKFLNMDNLDKISGKNSKHFKGTIYCQNKIDNTLIAIEGGIKELRNRGLLSIYYRVKLTGLPFKGLFFYRNS